MSATVSHSSFARSSCGNRKLFALCANYILLAVGCADQRSEAPVPLTVCVAASLTDVVQQLADEFEREHRQTVLLNSGASGALRKQIELGSQCDVFIPADAAYLEGAGKYLFRNDSPTPLAANTLVVAARAGHDALDWPGVLTTPRIDRAAIADPDASPAGVYAQQALENLGLWQAVQPKLIPAQNVRAAARYLALGTVDAALVYGSDAAVISDIEARFVFPTESHDAIEYVGAVTARCEEPVASQSLLASFASTSARSTWKRFGFADVGEDHPVARLTAKVGETDPDIGAAIGLSIRISLIATALSLVPGVLLAVWLARTKSRLRWIVDVCTSLPLVVPPVVVGFALLIAMRAMDVDLMYTPWAAAIASAVVAFPLLVRTVRVAVEAIDPRLAVVAATLGASRFRILRTITLPLAWRGIVGGATLAWARALGEFGATIVVAGNVAGKTRTLPLAIWTAIQSPTGKPIGALIVAAVLLSIGAVMVSEICVRSSPPSATHARS